MRSPVSRRALGECNAIRGRSFGESELTFVLSLETVLEVAFFHTVSVNPHKPSARFIMPPPGLCRVGCGRPVDPTRLVGIIKATPGTRAEHRLVDTVPVSSPAQPRARVLSL
jgi:hypothetical protein